MIRLIGGTGTNVLTVSVRKKLAKITHFGLITNISQMGAFEGFHKSDQTETTTGAIPFSHSYGLALGHLVAWRGDSLIVFPRFDIQMMLKSIPQFKIERLYLVGIQLILWPSTDLYMLTVLTSRCHQYWRLSLRTRFCSSSLTSLQ